MGHTLRFSPIDEASTFLVDLFGHFITPLAHIARSHDMLRHDLIPRNYWLLCEALIVYIMLLFVTLHDTVKSLAANQLLLLEEFVANHLWQNRLMSESVHLFCNLLLDLHMPLFSVEFNLKAIDGSHHSMGEDFVRVEISIVRSFRPMVGNWTLSLFAHTEVVLLKLFAWLPGLLVANVEAQADEHSQRHLLFSLLILITAGSQIDCVAYKTTYMIVLQLLELRLREHICQEPQDFHVCELDFFLRWV